MAKLSGNRLHRNRISRPKPLWKSLIRRSIPGIRVAPRPRVVSTDVGAGMEILRGVYSLTQVR